MRLWELLDTKSASTKILGESAKKPLNITQIESRLIVPAKGPIKPR